jgi:hypothetical protein
MNSNVGTLLISVSPWSENEYRVEVSRFEKDRSQLASDFKFFLTHGAALTWIEAQYRLHFEGG